MIGTYYWYQSRDIMASNKERIENLEVGLGGLYGGLSSMEIGLADKMRAMEANIQQLTETFASHRDTSSSN